MLLGMAGYYIEAAVLLKAGDRYLVYIYEVIILAGVGKVIAFQIPNEDINGCSVYLGRYLFCSDYRLMKLRFGSERLDHSFGLVVTKVICRLNYEINYLRNNIYLGFLFLSRCTVFNELT